MDTRLRSASDEEFDLGNLFNQSAHNGEDSRLWFVVCAFVERVDYNDCRNPFLLERRNNQLLHLIAERLVSNIWVRLEERDENRSKVGVSVCELERKSGEYEAEVAAVLEIARAKERCPQQPISEEPLGSGLGNCGFSGPSESVEPVYRRLVKVFGPGFDFVQYGLPCPGEASLAIAVLISCSASTGAGAQYQ